MVMHAPPPMVMHAPPMVMHAPPPWSCMPPPHGHACPRVRTPRTLPSSQALHYVKGALSLAPESTSAVRQRALVLWCQLQKQMGHWQTALEALLEIVPLDSKGFATEPLMVAGRHHPVGVCVGC